MEAMKPKVSIIILNWNGWKDTVECLESLYRIDYHTGKSSGKRYGCGEIEGSNVYLGA